MQRCVLLGLCGIGLAWLAGCAQDTAEPTLLVQGERAYTDRQFAVAHARLTTYLRVTSKPDAELQARALYIRALAAAQLGRRSEALGDLEQAARITRDKEIRWRINALRGTIHYEDGGWSSAIHALEAAVAEMPARPPMDTYLFRLGECYERAGRWNEARAAFRRLLERFPGTPHAASARKRTEVQATSYAVQCGVFTSSANAERMANDLRSKGLPATVRPEVRAGRVQYLVLVGNYARYEEARGALARVKGHVPTAILWP